MANSLNKIFTALAKDKAIKVRDIQSKEYTGQITGIRKEGGIDLWLVTIGQTEICVCAS